MGWGVQSPLGSATRAHESRLEVGVRSATGRSSKCWGTTVSRCLLM